MNKMPLKYQIGLFGNFDNIQQTPEIVKKLLEIMQKFNSHNLLLNTMTEITFDPQIGIPLQINRISFNDHNSGLAIMFGSKRLDFIKELRDEHGTNMGELRNFIEEMKKLILELSNSFEEIQKFNRLSLIHETIFSELTETEKNSVYTKTLNQTFFLNEAPQEWSVRTVHKLDSGILQEKINSILSIDRTQGQLIVNNQPKNIDGFKVLLDINTLAENTNLRFNVDSINQFLEETTEQVTQVLFDIQQKLLV